MANPKGTPENLKPRQRVGAVPLADKPVCVKLQPEIDAFVRSLPDEERSAWLRQVISEAVLSQLEKLKPEQPYE